MTIKLLSPLNFNVSDKLQEYIYIIYLILTNDLNRKTFESFTPTLTPSGSMGVSSVVSDCRYMIIGGIVTLEINVTLTLSGTPSNSLSFTLPFTPEKSGKILCVINDGSNQIGILSYTGASDTATIQKYDGSNYNVGVSRTISITGIYSTNKKY